ncbi:hypothetical protein N7493_003837 [Penicillium malachiteum]|uniref:Uncharacterized protein n=1 Tax=Penicillium malachiteum TaxID=1324776 RepID=A0AAD6HR29_9EURO|nr:hypothetical protein N7493_003837 [Penicillium malachiteum]
MSFVQAEVALPAMRSDEDEAASDEEVEVPFDELEELDEQLEEDPWDSDSLPPELDEIVTLPSNVYSDSIV